MILLDTNVMSEMMKLTPAPQVMDWIDQKKNISLFVSTVTIAEISYGLNALPEGKRRQQLEEAFDKAIRLGFEHRIMPFDASAAHVYGKIMAQRKAAGRPLSAPDGQIAAIAHAQGFILATRNGRDFIDCGIEIVNPFD